MSTQSVQVIVNGRHRSVDVEPRTLLSDALREELGLLGLHSACEQGVCGSCTVLIDGRSVRSCLTFAVQVADAEVVTIEGVGSADVLHHVQDALSRHHGLQCGYCTPGVVLSAIELLDTLSEPTRNDVEEWMSGNLCRCTGYSGIINAICDVAQSRSEVAQGDQS
ncbi:MAG: hypothetical protein CL424_03890 [Acidimicrobiaceae bacterium]|nr:hypothetical protein [Acidimicrobiaceae bacterium]